MKEEMRTFGYLCPQCGKTVMGTRSVFALEASNAEVECACGKSALKVEFDGTEYHIYVPCGICGGVFSASAIALVESIANAKIQAIVFFIAGFISFI